MTPLFPSNPDPARFANKYKSLLTCVATGITTKANGLSEFEQLLDSDAFAPPNTKGYRVGCWRLLPLLMEQELLDSSFVDQFPERYDTHSPEFTTIYPKARVIDGFYHKIPKDIQKRILIAQTWIPWSPKMKQILDSIPLLHRVLGVSVRTWKASHDSCALAAHRAKSFNLQNYLDVIAKLENKVEAIFFSFDSPEAEAMFKDVKIPRINYKPDASLSCSAGLSSNSAAELRSSALTSIQKAAVDAQILGNCGLIIGDKLSTFPEVAWWMGGCRADVILV